MRPVIAAMLGPLAASVCANLWWLVPGVLLVVVAVFPMPRRGPNSSDRDAWRGFKYAPRQAVLARAGGRCEGTTFVIWGRCTSPAEHVDHVFPWSRGGPTVASNGQALCAAHNRSKGARTPPWWYVLGLERRRRTYFPAGADVRVLAIMDDADRAARAASGRRTRTLRPGR